MGGKDNTCGRRWTVEMWIEDTAPASECRGRQANVSLPIDGHVVPRSNTATQGARADEGLTPAGVEVMG